ncbi:hypothetical protein [Streptomonospora salina]|uniref:Uncharacterized protein n=1 Tax=Streptomonospora salina TaxID=104205 RepID=A0A841E1P6_9ACTN|nr:hypothetical protein [Streptomonospora salina]MBB5997055.1 hypothetical protein [Streptomonospora salina]
MEQEQEARAARDGVRRRQEAVGRELGRYRPVWWMTALYVLGMYLVMASIELGAAGSLLVAGGGFAALVVSGVLAIVRAGRSPVGARRPMWTPLRLAVTAAWLVGILAVFLLADSILDDHLAEWLAPFAAGLPAAVVTWFFAQWMWWVSFGPRRSSPGAR